MYFPAFTVQFIHLKTKKSKVDSNKYMKIHNSSVSPQHVSSSFNIPAFFTNNCCIDWVLAPSAESWHLQQKKKKKKWGVGREGRGRKQGVRLGLWVWENIKGGGIKASDGTVFVWRMTTWWLLPKEWEKRRRMKEFSGDTSHREPQNTDTRAQTCPTASSCMCCRCRKKCF